MHSCTLANRFDVEQCTCVSQKRLWRQASQAAGVLGTEPYIVSSSSGSGGGGGGASGIMPPSIGRPPPSTAPSIPPSIPASLPLSSPVSPCCVVELHAATAATTTARHHEDTPH